MSDSILKNIEHAKLLADQGFVIIPFLSSEEIVSLTEVFNAHHPSLPEGMYASAHAGDFSLRQLMNDKISAGCARAIAEMFQKAIPLGATYMTKSKGANGALNPHQDWNIVDEKKYNSYNIWIPLVDVNEANGTIMVLPKSHLMVENIRGVNIKSSFESVSDQVWQHLIPVNMKAGEALVYDHRLLHASGLNLTDTPRLVMVYGIIPEEASMRYYFGKGDEIEEYECSPAFFFNQQITNGPSGLKMLRVIKNENPQVSLHQLEKKPMPQTKGIWETITSWWR